MTLEGATLSIELVMRGRRALVLGGCDECAYKVDRLLACGAQVLLLAEGTINASIEEHARASRIIIERRAFRDDDWLGVAVTFVSPDLENLGARLAEEAERSGRLVSTLDRPAASTFINPAVVEKSGIKLALSSGGVAPALLRRMREELEIAFADPRLSRLVEALREKRAALLPGTRRAALAEAVSGFALRVSFTFPEWLDALDHRVDTE